MTTALNQRKRPLESSLVAKDPSVVLQDFKTLGTGQGRKDQQAVGSDEKMYWYDRDDQTWYQL